MDLRTGFGSRIADLLASGRRAGRRVTSRQEASREATCLTQSVCASSQGRGFTEADRHLRPQVAVVNETAAKALDGPAGSILRVAPRSGDFQSSTEVRIVGVVEAAIEPRLEQGEPPAAKIYLPSPIQPEPALALYVRTSGTASALAQPLRELVSQIGPRVPVLELGSLAEFNERSYATQLWLARAAAVMGAIGLLLATAGLYGVSSYLVAMRSRELAIRMAVGAAPRDDTGDGSAAVDAAGRHRAAGWRRRRSCGQPVDSVRVSRHPRDRWRGVRKRRRCSSYRPCSSPAPFPPREHRGSIRSRA